ncbi:MAG TPA: alkaline phosphatase family protein [Polyangiaceae bacterium]|nr:alkaline phosphatase family protein [Polyangiaceae bacterium]
MNRQELHDRVDTIVIVMMENRSFDHLLGTMCQPQFGGRTDIDGVKSLLDPNFANPASDGTLVFPFVMKDDAMTNDLPHERDFVALQLASSDITGGPSMTGFVKAYERATGTTGVKDPPVMGLLTPADLPTTGFLAREYAVCDRWFAPIPASTQPNRLMAISGFTDRDVTISGLLPNQETLFQWLDAHQVRWRVYSAGLSFFTLMPKMWPYLLTDRFRRLPQLSFDFVHESDATRPQVIVVEPDYDDSPVHLSGHACDNHPPLPMSFGEAFVRQVYEALTSNPGRWQRTVMIVTYDEHGGFHDHVAPLPVRCPPPPGANYPVFETTGVRVPTIVASPLVQRGVAKHANLDHTSILALLAERFGQPGETYSPEVAARATAGIASVSAVLDSGPPRSDVPHIPPSAISATASLKTWAEPVGAMANAYASAIEQFAQAHGNEALEKYPEIAHWLSP